MESFKCVCVLGGGVEVLLSDQIQIMIKIITEQVSIIMDKAKLSLLSK